MLNFQHNSTHTPYLLGHAVGFNEWNQWRKKITLLWDAEWRRGMHRIPVAFCCPHPRLLISFCRLPNLELRILGTAIPKHSICFCLGTRKNPHIASLFISYFLLLQTFPQCQILDHKLVWARCKMTPWGWCYITIHKYCNKFSFQPKKHHPSTRGGFAEFLFFLNGEREGVCWNLPLRYKPAKETEILADYKEEIIMFIGLEWNGKGQDWLVDCPA